MEQAALWEAFKQHGCEAAREQLILAHLRYVGPTVTRAVPNIPASIQRGDLESEAMLAVVKAIDRFNPAQGVQSSSWIVSSIRFRLCEYLRQEDWVPRSVRTKQRRLAEATEQALFLYGRADDRTVADLLKIDRGQLQRWRHEATARALVSMEAPALTGGPEEESVKNVVACFADPAPLPCARVLARWDRDTTHLLVRALAGNERHVIEGYYFRSRTHLQLAREMDLSETRAHQIHQTALARLRCFARAKYFDG